MALIQQTIMRNDYRKKKYAWSPYIAIHFVHWPKASIPLPLLRFFLSSYPTSRHLSKASTRKEVFVFIPRAKTMRR